MADYLKRNLQALQKNNPLISISLPLLADFLNEKIKEQDVIYQNDKLYFNYNENYYQVYGRNPKEEAIRICRNIDLHKENLIVVFGLGNIELLHYLYSKTDPGTKIAVFEPNLDMLVYCLKYYNLSEYIASNKFGFLFGDEDMLTRQIITYFTGSWENLVQNLQVVSLPNYYVYQKYQQKILHFISEKIQHLLLTLGNSLEDMLDGLDNHYKNIDASVNANSYEEFSQKFKGYPAIIVASGPSLDKNISELKRAVGKALIISCDASYTTCIQHGVEPDAIACIERGVATYNSFFKDRTFHDDLVLVGPSLLWPELHEKFPGKQLLFAKNYVGLEGWWHKHFKNSKFIDMGHSCATAAYAFAKEAGCDPIILIGQDLAFTGDKRHSDTVQKDGFKAKNELGEKAKKNNNLWVESIDGGKVRTTDIFNLFRYFFETEALKNITVIDATEGGALIHGTKIMTFSEAIEQYCTKKLPYSLKELLGERNISNQERLEIYEEVLKSTDEMITTLENIQNKAVEHYEEIVKYKEIDYDNASFEELVELVKNMQKGNEIVTYIRKEAAIAESFYQQIIKQTVIYVKKIGNEITGKTVKRNWELQVNLLHMIDISSAATMNLLNQHKKILEEKRDKLKIAEGSSN